MVDTDDAANTLANKFAQQMRYGQLDMVDPSELLRVIDLY